MSNPPPPPSATSTSATAPAKTLSEKTFTAYTKDQGAAYAKSRSRYNPKLYKLVLDHHTSTGGRLDTVLDIGCGPGTAVRALAPHFKHAIGLDPSPGMLSTATELAGSSATGESIRFELSTAEDLGAHLSPPVAPESVDLLVAATAAHWFDMPRFWPAAARILAPGGTVALWTTGSVTMHPSMPSAVAIQAALDEIEEREIRQYFEPGNLLTRTLYAGLPMPWTLSEKVEAFEESSLMRKTWGPENSEDFFEGGALTLDLDQMEKVLSTGSPVQRWRDAHPEDVGTERDVLRVMRRVVERMLRAEGVEEGKEIVKGSLEGVLLMVKKRAA